MTQKFLTTRKIIKKKKEEKRKKVWKRPKTKELKRLQRVPKKRDILLIIHSQKSSSHFQRKSHPKFVFRRKKEHFDERRRRRRRRRRRMSSAAGQKMRLSFPGRAASSAKERRWSSKRNRESALIRENVCCSARRRGGNGNAANANASSPSSSSSSPWSSNDFDDRVEEASMAVQRAETLAVAAEAELKALNVKLSSSSSSSSYDDDAGEEQKGARKTSARVQELKKSLEEMKQANLELRKKKGKAASPSSPVTKRKAPSPSSSSTPVSRLAAMEREEEKINGLANKAVDDTNNFSGGSQRRLYDQMLTLRTRLNERVAASNAFAKYLEKTLLTRDDDLKRANELLYGAAKESGELLRLIRDAQNDIVKSGDDATRRARGEQKLEKFVNRLQLVESTLTKNAKEIDSTVVRTVPLEYHGIASDVIMMGDFDGWTRGIQLYPSFVEGGSSTFTGEARLPPGTYLVKFKVDGEWRLAREWPSSGEGFDANNVLTVM